MASHPKQHLRLETKRGRLRNLVPLVWSAIETAVFPGGGGGGGGAAAAVVLHSHRHSHCDECHYHHTATINSSSSNGSNTNAYSKQHHRSSIVGRPRSPEYGRHAHRHAGGVSRQKGGRRLNPAQHGDYLRASV